MSKTHKVAGRPGLDPTLPLVEITLGDKTFNLCFTFTAFSVAATTLRARGIQCNLLQSLDLSTVDADRVGPLLYAAMLTQHPTITIEQVEALITFPELGNIVEKIVEAYSASLADPVKKSGTEGKA